jgi:hypothetical protein
MENNKSVQEPAFASIAAKPNGLTVGYNGMSKRFYAACCAMQGLLSGNLVSISTPDDAIIEMSYELADEILKQENL